MVPHWLVHDPSPRLASLPQDLTVLWACRGQGLPRHSLAAPSETTHVGAVANNLEASLPRWWPCAHVGQDFGRGTIDTGHKALMPGVTIYESGAEGGGYNLALASIPLHSNEAS